MGWDQIKARAISHKGKSAVLVLFLLVVFVPPLFYLIPAGRSKIIQFSASLIAKGDDAFFRKYISLLKEQNLETAYAMMTEKTQAANPSSVLQKIMPTFANTTDKMEIVGASVKSTKSLTSPNAIGKIDYVVDYEVEGTDPGKYILVQLLAEKTDEQLGITDLHAAWRSSSVRETGGSGLLQSGWFYVLLGIVLPLLAAYSALDYVVNGENPRWWLFLVVIFLNIYISLNNNIFQLMFGFYSFASLQSGSWILAIPLPIGAICYWMLLRWESKNPAIGR